MSVPIGFHKIRTSTGKYVTLAAQNDPLTATPPSGAYTQVWDFQPSGIYWTIKNNGYSPSTYAHSTGVSGTSISGNPLATEWTIIPTEGVYSIQLASNTSSAWSLSSNDQVHLGVTQLQNPAQRFTIE